MSDADLAGSGSSPHPRTFSGKLSRLFDVLRPAGGRPISTRDLAARVKEHGGSISPTYVSELRTGKRSNPTMEHIIGIAAAFGVPAGYFTDPEVAERVDLELDRLEAFQSKPELAALAEQTVTVNLRTADLDDGDRAELSEMVAAYLSRRGRRSKP